MAHDPAGGVHPAGAIRPSELPRSSEKMVSDTRAPGYGPYRLVCLAICRLLDLRVVAVFDPAENTSPAAATNHGPRPRGRSPPRRCDPPLRTPEILREDGQRHARSRLRALQAR